MYSELLKRYLLLIPGVFFVALGIAFTTKSDLGTSPISAIPYTLSLIIPWISYGKWTIMWNVLLVLSQLAMLRQKKELPQLSVQIVICFMLGYFVDFCMWLLRGLNPVRYMMRIVVLAIGCMVLGVGVYTQLKADVAMSPGDGHARVLTWFFKKDYSRTRIVQDMSFTVTAMVLSLLFLHGLKGAREGTVIAAFLVGFIVGLYKKAFDKPVDAFMKRFIISNENSEKTL